ncbi:uncharacterized protein LOC120011229 isoform X2 [Tripterygium wilfordii]|uniref:uncharacterized protein LOC120011229 isoform X2 n=1 Tax=Tripterygium wilfordii TaxID=458696 RepID=UPI0018F81999|nr:uncharacterized protein LOC120011229 isoform X2 [Tripterygium wilfordii]
MSKKMEQIKEEDKFFNRLMSKELASSSSLNTSSHHYYVGASGSVPFLWESQPGTPKHVLFSDLLQVLSSPRIIIISIVVAVNIEFPPQDQVIMFMTMTMRRRRRIWIMNK